MLCSLVRLPLLLQSTLVSQSRLSRCVLALRDCVSILSFLLYDLIEQVTPEDAGLSEEQQAQAARASESLGMAEVFYTMMQVCQ
jgi:hypothetical protein